ncbi:hypothetical protein pipiens_004978 [Culex pipiens pipiens]|uniref:Uncharacterized protein n=1 Tax=Culex pipiens pipiens TaxID=38569 RepID=A0ABD1CCS4_CULPP
MVPFFNRHFSTISSLVDLLAVSRVLCTGKIWWKITTSKSTFLMRPCAKLCSFLVNFGLFPIGPSCTVFQTKKSFM